MRYLLTLLVICSALLMQAKDYKIDRKERVQPYELKIEKFQVKGPNALLYVKIKQQKRFSYNVSFDNCYITLPGQADSIKGTLTKWNDEKKIYRNEKPVSDEGWEEAVISFPVSGIFEAPSFDLMLGNILDRKRTELRFKSLVIKNKF